MITITDISKNFDQLKAVDNLNLKIKEGECLGLLGRNGAGKSTTIKMMVGLLRPDNGTIEYDGLNINNNPLDIKSKLAYIPDTAYVYDKLSGIEFLYFVGYMYGMTNEQVKERAGKLLNLFDLQTSINKKAEGYSHGMKQKLVLTASFMHNPKYLIIDEPMVGLDPQSAKITRNLIKKICKEVGTSVILTTHQLHVADDTCDRIAIIHEGKVLKFFENKNDFKDKLEDEFIKLTGGYDEDELNDIFK